uniref:Uncharacterized protein n=1 Tax=Lates calcarifer TaxID=8187 RepID=A0A4W6BX16_LATCA
YCISDLIYKVMMCLASINTSIRVKSPVSVCFSSPGAVARACNPSYWEAEAGGSFELRSSVLQRTMPIGSATTPTTLTTAPHVLQVETN